MHIKKKNLDIIDISDCVDAKDLDTINDRCNYKKQVFPICEGLNFEYWNSHEWHFACSTDRLKQLALRLTMEYYWLINDIEANLRIEEESKRTIHLSVHEKKGLILLQCENPYAGSVILKDGLPETSKTDKENHGIGTRSILSTAAQYGGTVRINTDENMYVLRIIFTNQDEKMYS